MRNGNWPSLRWRQYAHCHCKPQRRRLTPHSCGDDEAPSPRAERRRAKQRERTLLGFDFNLGFPRGLASALKLPSDAPWKAVWKQVDHMVKDKADNTNNRFGVASEINRRLTGGPTQAIGCRPTGCLETESLD